MNREFVIYHLEQIKDGLLKDASHPYANTGECEWLSIQAQALDMAIAALREPVLDENGLVRCGVCGKSPTYEEFNDGFFDLDRVECRGCGVMVTSACEKSKAKWNAMRGYKGADE